MMSEPSVAGDGPAPERAAPVAVVDAPAHPKGTEPCTDLWNAEELVARHGRDLFHVPELGGWYGWDGRRWHLDNAGAERRAKAVARAMAAEAAQEAAVTARLASQSAESGDEEQAGREQGRLLRAKRLLAWATKSQSARGLAAMLEVARSEAAVAGRAGQLDAEPWLLCCANGTVDLRTGKLQSHRREDRLTRLCPAVYDPTARSEVWDEFLRQATNGDAELVSFLQRAVGYSLTGDTREEKLFFVHGPPAAGKSTFLEAVKATIGDHASTADFETFLQKKGDAGPRNDIARLVGARMVVSIEVDDGKRLAEGLVKQLTGGDTVSARFLYREGFEFKPAFKLWLAANHAPRISDDDPAMWRRVVRVPFDRSVPKERRDPRIKAFLTNPSAGGAAILAWAVRGCLAWQSDGLQIPHLVEEATEEYRQQNDPLRDFFEDRCVIEPGDPECWISVKTLRKEYEEWAKEQGLRFPLGPREFNKRLVERGCRDKAKTVSGTVFKAWFGVRLKTAADAAKVES